MREAVGSTSGYMDTPWVWWNILKIQVDWFTEKRWAWIPSTPAVKLSRKKCERVCGCGAMSFRSNPSRGIISRKRKPLQYHHISVITISINIIRECFFTIYCTTSTKWNQNRNPCSSWHKVPSLSLKVPSFQEFGGWRFVLKEWPSSDGY